MSTNIIQPSFSAGELSPTMYGRVDMAKYRVGAAVMRNFFVDYRGGASNRPGTEFIGACRSYVKDVRLIPFQFSTVQTYALEFGDLYMRVIKNGAYVLETPITVTAATQGNPAVFTAAAHGLSNGDWVYMLVTAGMTSLTTKTFIVTAVTTNTFQLLDIFGVPLNTINLPAWSAGTVTRYYTLATPYLAEDLATLKFVQSADTLTLTHPNYQPRDLTRTGDNAWALTALSFGATATPPTNGALAATTGTGAYYAYGVTTVNQNGEESVCSDPILGSNLVNISTTSGTITVSWDAVVGAAYYNVYRAQIVTTSGGVQVGALLGYVGTSYGTRFNDPNIIPDYTKTPPIHYDPFAPSQVSSIDVTAGGTGYTSSSVVSITTSTGSGFRGRVVTSGGAVKAIIVDNPGTGYDPADTVSVSVGSGATFTLNIGPSGGTYPGTVTYFQQRRVFAASTNYPQTIWMTKVGNIRNFDRSNPVIASDSITATLASQQVNNVKHMVSMPGGLVILTGGGAWQVSGGSQNAAVTPINAVATPQAYSGCSDVPPIVVNYDILYVQAKGSTVRDLAYNFFTNIYTGTDISILSNHLLHPHRIVEWAWAEEPFRLIWSVRDDGILLSTTFIKEQEVIGWARHDTQGLFQSVCTIQEGNQNAVYFVVKRFIRGQWVQYVERLADRTQVASDEIFPSDDFWFSDCALDYPLIYPAGILYPGASSGTGVNFRSDQPVFAIGDVGKVIRAGGGVATVTAFVDAQNVTVTIRTPIAAVVPNDDGTPIPIDSGLWSMVMPVTTVTGLDHLEGMYVKVLADGAASPDTQVVNGSITLPHAASRIIVGLGYVCQLQTLPLDTGESSGGSSQGKRKKIPAVTLKLSASRGLKAGPTFDDSDLTPLKATYMTYGDPPMLQTGDQRIVLNSPYTTQAQLCFQQDYPLPATILAIVPEVVLGDTQQ